MDLTLRRRAGMPSTGIFLHLVSIGLVAGATVAAFLGIGVFSLLQPAAESTAAPLPRESSGDVSLEPVIVALPPATMAGAAALAPQLPKKAEASIAAAAVAPGAGLAAPVLPAIAPHAPSVSPAAPAEIEAPSDERLPAAEIGALLARGDAVLRTGDIASARLFYERAAEAGDGQAALRASATFDPAFLAGLGLRSMQGDPAAARWWYARARQLGAAPN